MAKDFIIGYENFKKALTAMTPGSRDNRKLLGQIGRNIVTVVKLRFGRPFGDGLSPLTIHNRRGKGKKNQLEDSGNLKKSITHVVMGSKKVAVGSALKYAATVHNGKEITPVKAKKLAIPNGPQISSLTKKLGVKGTLDKFEKDGWNIWFREKTIMGSKKGSDAARVLYIRRDSVTIPPRPFLYTDDTMQKMVAETIKEWYNSIQ